MNHEKGTAYHATTTTTASAGERPASPVFDAVCDHADALEATARLVRALEDRLSSVLLPGIEDDPKAQQVLTKQAHGELLCRIFSLTERANNTARMLESILNRLEL